MMGGRTGALRSGAPSVARRPLEETLREHESGSSWRSESRPKEPPVHACAFSCGALGASRAQFERAGQSRRGLRPHRRATGRGARHPYHPAPLPATSPDTPPSGSASKGDGNPGAIESAPRHPNMRAPYSSSGARVSSDLPRDAGTDPFTPAWWKPHRPSLTYGTGTASPPGRGAALRCFGQPCRELEVEFYRRYSGVIVASCRRRRSKKWKRWVRPPRPWECP